MAIVQPDSHLGPYEVLAQVGAGGMGEVWKARDKRLDRIVAIKTSSEQFSERFEREGRAVAALNHPPGNNAINHNPGLSRQCFLRGYHMDVHRQYVL
jgi:serine/threonine protein kinase